MCFVKFLLVESGVRDVFAYGICNLSFGTAELSLSNPESR